MDTLSTARPILVALGSEAQSLRLIQAGYLLARERSVPWIAAFVDTGLGAAAEDREQVQVWFQEAQRLGGTTQVVEAPTLAQGLTDLVRRNHAQALVLGRSRDRWPWARLGHATADELQRRGLATELVVLEDRAYAAHTVRPPVDAQAMLGAMLVLAAATGMAWLIPMEGSLTLVLPIYLLAVTFIGQRWGARLGVLASTLSVLFYNFLLETPRFHQAASHWPNLLFFLLMLLGAQASVSLLERLRYQAREVKRRELHTASLYMLGRALARSHTQDEIALTAAEHIQRVFKAEAWLLFPEADGWITRPAPFHGAPLPPPSELLPRLAVGERRGDPLEPLPLGKATCLSLMGTDRCEGVLRILTGSMHGLPPENWELLKAFAVQIALALERLRWLEEARRAHVQNETERLRSTLLGAIGHDLRTPLAAIHGAASSLLLPGEVSESTRQDLLAMIQDESDRLAQLLGNLLDLTRLESGAVAVQKDWQPLEEVVGSALGRLERRLGTLPVEVELPEDLPLAPFDAALFEQVLVNLLTNALHHAPNQPVTLRAWADASSLRLEVADRGPGIPEAYQDRIFDKFYRLPGAGDGGVGLGLAICKAILQAHGGTIQVMNRPGGGSLFQLALPMEGLPPAGPGGAA